MGNLPNVRVYLDDKLITLAGSYEDHLKHVEMVLHLLDISFAVNLRKSSFAVTEIFIKAIGLPVAVFNLNLRKWKRSCG